MSSKEDVTIPVRADFEVPLPPIPDKEIKDTITADVIVVGCGIAGLTASLSAVEAGAKCIVLEKLPTFNFRGGWNAAFNSRLQKQQGIKVNKDDVIQTVMEVGSYRSDQRVVKKWADNADEVMEWLLDMAEADGQPVVLDPVTRDWYFKHYPVSHLFVSRDKGNSSLQMNLAELLYKNGKAKGVDYRFETPAARLIREGKGRVEGVIAKNNKGEYIRFNAKNAVILCSGDYGNNREMVKKYCPWQANVLFGVSQGYSDATIIATGHYDGKVNTGDGQQMGMWIGAAIDDAPHCVMFYDRTNAGAPPDKIAKKGQVLMRYFLDVPRQPWLTVNINGERFMNEDIPFAFEANQYMTQPEYTGWKIFDSKYELEWPRFKGFCCKSMGAPMYRHKPDFMQKGIEWGAIIVAHTLEELAQKINVPVDTFKATVERYNRMTHDGKDLDFGKHIERMSTVEFPPFYACKTSGQYLVTLGGLKINPDLQVLDTERKPIPGLYAAGNVSGSFWGDEYPITIPGASHSRAWTFGRLAGLAAAKKPK
jgi:fumarate reductase flavoprotein subunit